MSVEQQQQYHRPNVHGSPRARKISKIAIPVAVIALIGFSLFNVYLTLNREGLPEEIEGLVTYPDVANEVVDGPIDYEVHPPYGGPNAGVIQDCGRYRVPVRDENAVASLAIGAVWIAYDPSIGEEEIDMLHSHGAGEMYVIVAPYPGLRAPIVMTAWGAQVEIDSSLDPRIQAFIRDYAESDNVPIPNRPCSGGVSIPAE